MSTLGDMVVAITGDTTNFNLSIDAAGKKFDSLTTIIAQSSSDIAASFKKIDNEAKLWGNSTDLIKEKQIELKNEMTKLMSQGFDPLSPKVQSLKTQYDALSKEAETLNKTHVTLKGSLQEIDGMMGGLGSKILHLASNPYVLLTAAVVGVTKFVTDSIKELVEYGTTIQRTSEKTGMSTKALQEWKYVAEQTGGSLETITASIKMMTRGLDTNADTYKQLGIQIKDSNGQFRSSTDIFDETVKALGDLTNDTERTKLALKLFGRGALDMVPLLKEGSKGIEELKQKANDLGLVLSDKTISGAYDLEKATDSLKASWKSFTMQLVQDSIPALTTIVNRLNEVATIAHLKGVVEENNKIIASYVYLRDDVIAYHDALESNLEIAERDVKSTYTTQKVKQDAAKKIIELTKSLQYIESEYNSKKKIQDDKDAETARKKAADDSVLNKLKQEIETLQSLRDARDKATKEYQDEVTRINQLDKDGNDLLITKEDKQKQLNDASLKYAQALVPIVESSKELKKISPDMYNKETGGAILGAESLGTQLGILKINEDDLAIATANATYAEQDAKNKIAEKEAAEKSATETLLADIKASQEQTKAILTANEAMDKTIDKYDLMIVKLENKGKKTDDVANAEEQAAIDEVNNSKATDEAKQKAIDKIKEYYALLKDKTATDKAKENFEKYASQVLSTVSSLVSSLKSLYSADAQNKKDSIANELEAAEDAIDKELEAKEEAAGVAEDTALEAAQKELKIAQDTVDGLEQVNDAKKTLLDEEEEAKLYSLGLVEASTLEEYDAEIAAAIAAGDTATAATLQAARDKLAIEKEYDAKRQAIDDAQTLKDAQDAATKAALEQEAADKKTALENQAALDTYDVEVATFKTDQKLSYIQAVIDTASAVMQSAKSLPWPLNLIPMAASAALGAVQMATIAKQSPPAPPILAAEGGIFPATSGGTNVQLAEAGETEVVFPLSKLESFLSSYTGSTSNSDTTPVQLSIQLDSNTLYSGIFAATRNKTVLISAKAVV